MFGVKEWNEYFVSLFIVLVGVSFMNGTTITLDFCINKLKDFHSIYKSREWMFHSITFSFYFSAGSLVTLMREKSGEQNLLV